MDIAWPERLSSKKSIVEAVAPVKVSATCPEGTLGCGGGPLSIEGLHPVSTMDISKTQKLLFECFAPIECSLDDFLKPGEVGLIFENIAPTRKSKLVNQPPELASELLRRVSRGASPPGFIGAVSKSGFRSIARHDLRGCLNAEPLVPMRHPPVLTRLAQTA